MNTENPDRPYVQIARKLHAAYRYANSDCFAAVERYCSNYVGDIRALICTIQTELDLDIKASSENPLYDELIDEVSTPNFLVDRTVIQKERASVVNKLRECIVDPGFRQQLIQLDEECSVAREENRPKVSARELLNQLGYDQTH